MNAVRTVVQNTNSMMMTISQHLSVLHVQVT